MDFNLIPSSTYSRLVCSIHLPRLPLIASTSVFSRKRFYQTYGVDHSIAILLTLALEIKQETCSRPLAACEPILAILRQSRRLSWNGFPTDSVRNKPFREPLHGNFTSAGPQCREQTTFYFPAKHIAYFTCFHVKPNISLRITLIVNVLDGALDKGIAWTAVFSKASSRPGMRTMAKALNNSFCHRCRKLCLTWEGFSKHACAPAYRPLRALPSEGLGVCSPLLFSRGAEVFGCIFAPHGFN